MPPRRAAALKSEAATKSTAPKTRNKAAAPKKRDLPVHSENEDASEQEESLPKPKKTTRAASKKTTKTDQDAASPVDDAEEVPKSAPQKRGRPAKTAARSGDDDAGENEDEEQPPKKRGRPARSAASKPASAAVDDAEEEEEAEDKVAPVSKGGKKTRGKGKAASSKKQDSPTQDADKEDEEMDDAPALPVKNVTVIKRGAAPVDPYSNLVSSHEVYTSGDEVFDAMLNQTNVSKNNNKFYVIQLLHPIGNSSQVTLHTRWGRVGENGSSGDKGPWAPATAINEFKKQFKAKTATSWEARVGMEPKPNKYVWVERGFDDDDKNDTAGSSDKRPSSKGKAEDEEPEPEVKAAPELQTLVQFIFNQTFISAHLEEMNYDANKLPLGKLAKSTILRGFAALKALAEVLDDPTCQTALDLGGSQAACTELTNRYYSVIPHAFGRRNPVLINNQTLLKRELEMLDALGNMEIASKVLNSDNRSASGQALHPIDSHLASLNLVHIEPLARSSKSFKALEKYAQDTHGSTHGHYKVNVESIFEIERDGEGKRWGEWEGSYLMGGKSKKGWGDGQRLLLWHGSRSTNFAGILKQGLRIAPPEAPVTGYMFGKGVYFADHMSKSANYCYASLSQNTGLLLLAEVAVDPFHELYDAKYDADVSCKAEKKLATKGVGRTQPAEWQDCGEALENDDLKGVQMPKGRGKDGMDSKAYLQYNEYIVYDVSQIRLRYLLKVKFA